MLRDLQQVSKSSYVLANPGTNTLPREISKKFGRIVAAFNEQAKKNKGTPLPSLTLHELRHTNASLLLANGVPVKVVSERLGHSDVKVTLGIYQHLLPSMGGEAAKVMERVLGPKAQGPKTGPSDQATVEEQVA
jgi:integrase